MGQSCHGPFAPAVLLSHLLALPGQAPDLITSRSHLTCLLSREDFSAAQTESGLRATHPRLSAVSPPSRAHGNSSVITGLPCWPGGHEGRAASLSDRRPRAGRCPWHTGAARKQPGNRDQALTPGPSREPTDLLPSRRHEVRAITSVRTADSGSSREAREVRPQCPLGAFMGRGPGSAQGQRGPGRGPLPAQSVSLCQETAETQRPWGSGHPPESSEGLLGSEVTCCPDPRLFRAHPENLKPRFRRMK